MSQQASPTHSSAKHSSPKPVSPTRKVLHYAFLPGVLPRVRRLGTHFGHFAFLLALVLRSARLLPAGHPMINPVNIGRFGIRDVMAAAANNLILRKENADQIMIFAAIMLAIVMILAQAVIIGFYAAMTPAQAKDGMFTTADPQNDTVLTLLQHIIGLDGFYNASQVFGTSVAKALHQMLGFYSTAMMVIAVIIVIYYVITVVGESAQSGTPFGRRFNGLWAPIRLVLALGLLVPLGSGLNAAQYLILYTAKFGSGLANNAWQKFETALRDTDNLTLPAYPVSLTETAKALVAYETCMAAFNMRVTDASQRMSMREIAVDQLTPSLATGGGAAPGYYLIQWTAKLPGSSAAGENFSCGTIKLPYINVPDDAPEREFTTFALNAYKNAVKDLAERIRPLAERYATYTIATSTNAEWGQGALPEEREIRQLIVEADRALLAQIKDSSRSYAESLIARHLDDRPQSGGWGMAGSYYMKVAFANGTIYEAAKKTAPQIERVQGSELAENVNTAAGRSTGWLGRLYDWWHSTDTNRQLGNRLNEIKSAVDLANRRIINLLPTIADQDFMTREGENAATKVVLYLFRVPELRNMMDPANQSVFPMVHLINLGAAIINRAVVALGGSVLLDIVGGLIPKLGAFTGPLSGIITLFGFVGIGIGFILFYVIPFMRFIYFFFAIIEWAMSIVEGLAGAPLWALAHLRIEGDGMPGPAAMNGYIILFGILIRPFLILFSLFASYIVFNAGAYFLNMTFGSAVRFVSEGGPSTLLPLGFVGYFILYGIIVYNLALVCFKLIDTIPQQTMRWLGQANLNFNDGRPDPIGNTTSVAAAAGAFMGPQLAGAIRGAGQQGITRGSKIGERTRERKRGDIKISEGKPGPENKTQS